WRIDHRIGIQPRGIPAKRPLAHYLRNNFYVTTSGNFCTQTLINTILSLGSDRILFSADYPFESMIEAAAWFDGVEISESDRGKIGYSNAERLFQLGRQSAASA
ncbi:MAG: amidohydrolase family protein, partial [Thermoguttaceae bacterium]